MSGVDIGLAAAVLGGIISFLSPCVLPLVPAYLCFVAGTSMETLTAQTGDAIEKKGLNRRVMIGAIAFVLGFSTVFIALGAGAAAINPLILAYKVPLSRIAGVIIILFGLHFMGLFKIGLFYREARFAPSLPKIDSEHAAWQMAGPYVLGLAFAFGWTPCIGPVLATILTLAAARESLGEGVMLLSAYSAGLGLPFLAAALMVDRFLGFAQRFRRHMHKVEIATGLLLAGTGVLILTGSLELIAIYMIEIFPGLAELG